MTEHNTYPTTGRFPRPQEEVAARVKAMESILREKGIITEEAIDYMSSVYENQVGPQLGAKVVAKAWTDPEFKKRLLEDATTTCKELDISGMQGEEMVVLENTENVHNMITCTLCSCYPWPVLGLPPNWFKYPAYRARAVREPREVLKEFGVELPESTEIRVWDSSSELRYWVLPRRPEGTDGMSAEELEKVVTRDSMIGTGLAGRGAS